MRASYEDWLRAAVPSDGAFRTKLSELRRVERAYGDLDEHYDDDELSTLIEEFTYSSADAANNMANPTKFEINGDIRNNLASYKAAIAKYQRFRQDQEHEDGAEPRKRLSQVEEDTPSLFGLEKDLQAALRTSMNQLEPGLTIADGGMEKTVPSGRIDVFASDALGAPVVVELKAVKAPLKAISQIMSYMGDIAEETGQAPRGILIAPDFDDKLVAAARIAPSIKLVRYGFSFQFSDVNSGVTT